MALWQTILFFGVVVIIFDGVWALVARSKEYNYARGTWVSLLIYLIAGGVTARSGGVLAGLLGGLITAGVEATIGWWISWKIGPGRLPNTDLRDTLYALYSVQ